MESGRRFRFWLNAYFVAVFVGIGGLQMYRVDAGLLTSYGADLLAPPWIYLASRRGRWRPGPATAFAIVLGGCVLWEWLQRYDWSGTPLAITRGTFDSLDLVAYVVGLVAVYALDVAWLQRRGMLPGSSTPDDRGVAGNR